MNKSPYVFLILVAFIFLATPSGLAREKAAKTAPPPPALDLRDGDTFVFFGDSITHQCLYTQFVEDFFYTRYPDRRIRFHNAGVGGDKAADALARFNDDVAALKPKYVSILLGMNDGLYEAFDRETFETYASGMSSILDRIGEAGAKPIVFTPTNFDHHQLGLRTHDESYRFRNRTFHRNYNSLLAFYGGWLREQAGGRGLPFVNQWGPLNDVTFAERRTDPDFTLVPDAIHPAPGGHFIMAFQLLWQVQPDRKSVSSIGITRRRNAWKAGAQGGKISGLVVSPEADRVSFTHTARSLPWVPPVESYGKAEAKKWGAEPSAMAGYRLMNAGHKLSNERLKIAGLAPGTYEVRIDGKTVATTSHITLGSRIELQSNEKTPQYRQALDVATLNVQRNNEAIRPMRDLWHQVKSARSGDREVPGSFEKRYAELKPKIAGLIERGRDFEDRIYAAAQPVPRKYEIVKVK